MKKFILLLIVTMSAMTCKQVNPNFQQEAQQVDYLHQSMQRLSDVIVHDHKWRKERNIVSLWRVCGRF